MRRLTEICWRQLSKHQIPHFSKCHQLWQIPEGQKVHRKRLQDLTHTTQLISSQPFQVWTTFNSVQLRRLRKIQGNLTLIWTNIYKQPRGKSKVDLISDFYRLLSSPLMYIKQFEIWQSEKLYTKVLKGPSQLKSVHRCIHKTRITSSS